MSRADPLSPLVSERSPSNERAREERLHPSPTGDAEIVALLIHLFEAEQDASRTCARAAAQVRDESLADSLRTEAHRHAARQTAFAGRVAELGGSVPNAGERHEILVHGPAAMARTRSDDEVIGERLAMRDELAAIHADARRRGIDATDA